MEKIFHPVSGELGYFATQHEKILIDAIFYDYRVNNLVVHSSESGENE